MNQLKRAVTAAAIVAALALAGCAGSSPGSYDPAPTAADPNTALKAALESAVTGLLGETGIPGAVFIVTQDGKELWSFVFNSPDQDAIPVALDQNFGYRSITKTFTVTALLMLVDEGEVSLDDPISKFVDGVPSGDEISLRNLAEMRSGLANYSALPEIGALINDDPTAPLTEEQLISPALAVPLVFSPGAQFSYSNTNTVLLGMVIEAVTGKPWGEEVVVLATEPLGLDSIAYPADGVIAEPSATPYQWTDDTLEQLPVVAPSMFGAAGGLFGNVTDLASWADELGSGSLLSAETQEARLASFRSATGDPNAPEYDAYGIGMGKIADYVGHTGNGLGFQSLAMNNPKTGVSVAILLNSTTSDSDLPAHLFKLMEPVLAKQ